MPNDIPLILQAVASQVWLIDEDKGNEIAAFLVARAAGRDIAWDGDENAPIYAADPVEGRRGPVHVLNLQGAIIPRAGMVGRMSGGASLEQFGKAFERAAADTSAQAIVLDIDSPGGAVDLVGETAQLVFRARRSDRPIIAVANSLAASAAYWIASAADELVVTPSGRVGSIGVYGMHNDISAGLEKMGIKRTVIKSGPRKAEGVFGPLDDAALAHQQKQADEMYAMFVKAVAKHRGVDASVVRADPETADQHFGGGRAYFAAEAVRLGMADRVATFAETLNRVAQAPRRATRRTDLARRRLAMM